MKSVSLFVILLFCASAQADFFFFCDKGLSPEDCATSVLGEKANAIGWGGNEKLVVDRMGKPLSSDSIYDICEIEKDDINCESVIPDFRVRCEVTSSVCSKLSSMIKYSSPPTYECERSKKHKVQYAAIDKGHVENHQNFGNFTLLHNGATLKALFCLPENYFAGQRVQGSDSSSQ